MHCITIKLLLFQHQIQRTVGNIILNTPDPDRTENSRTEQKYLLNQVKNTIIDTIENEALSEENQKMHGNAAMI